MTVRRSPRLLVTAAVTVLAALAGASAANAYRISRSPSGAEIYWPSGAFPVRFTFDTAGSADIGPDATHQTWSRAFETWQNVDCSYVAVQTTTSSQSDAIGGDGVNTVIFYEDRWFQGADGALAVTTPLFDVGSGQIGEADVIFNGALYQWATNGAPNRTDLEAVSTHEFGHAFGLDHPCELGGQGGAPDCCEYVQGFCQPITEYYVTTMFPATDPGNTSQRTLDQDDIAAICYLYDSGQPPPPPPKLGELGDSCSSGEQCRSQICVGLPDGSGVCSELCDGTCSQPGFNCEPLQGGGGACIRDPNLLTFGSACQTGEECASGQCVDDGAGGRFCTQTCGSCPDGYTCSEGLCRRGGGNGTGGGVGTPCTDTANCQPGFACVNDGRSQYCTTSCTATPDCGGGFECVQSVCVFAAPAGGNTGDACGAPTDCLTGQCINDGTSQYCSQGCATDGDCPGGFACFDAGGIKVCARTGMGPGNMGTPDGGGGGCSQAHPARPHADGLPNFFGLLLLVSVMAIPILARRPR